MKLLNIFVAGLLTVGVTSNAMAEYYVGGAVGQGDILDVSGYDKSTSVKVFGGWKQEHFGLEVAYVDLGDFDLSIPGFSVTSSLDGFEISALAYLPLGNKFDLFAKVGLFSWNGDAKVNNTAYPSDDGNDLTYGVGGIYKPTKSISLRAEYQIFTDIGVTDVSNISIGAAYHF